MRAWLLLGFLALVTCDVYLHGPRGSNNRLNERGRERANANRLFDSQNNNRGGYNQGSLIYYEGSIVNIEWTNQHSCGDPNNHCELVIQYMCGNQTRDGTTIRTIPDRRDQCEDWNCDTDLEFGMHENYAYYRNCKNRDRNAGLFVADQRPRGDARGTRQNPRGTRRGYECPEERDYYPYWHPTPWMDIAILTNNATKERCEFYKNNSENVKGRGFCDFPDDYFNAKEAANQNIADIPNNKAECEALNLGAAFGSPVWNTSQPFGIPAPECVETDLSRDNHNGNGINGYPNSFNWTVPNHTLSDNCVLRLRYNITTGEFKEGGFDPALNAALNGNAADVLVQEKMGVPTAAAANDDRGYEFENNPQVEVFDTDDMKLRLAINTAQYGRTFQDRTHVFAVRPLPTEIDAGDSIINMNVRGKRGNIVQVYPAVEYDFGPNRVQMQTGDYIHVQWTGSDTNPDNNDGQGRRGTDRSNMVLTREITYPKDGALTAERAARDQSGQLSSNYPIVITNDTKFMGFSKADIISAALIESTQFGGDMEELDDAGTYYNMGLRRITIAGMYNFMCTRNNNFSNRSQKGRIVVTESPFVAKKVGVAGGDVALPNGDASLNLEADALESAVMFYIEELDEDVADKAATQARRRRRAANDTTTGDSGSAAGMDTGDDSKDGNTASKVIAVYPLDFTVTNKDLAHLKIKFSSAASDTTFVALVTEDGTYASLPNDWIEEMGSGEAKFKIQGGGFYQVMKYPYVPVIIAFVILALVLTILIVGTIVYFKLNPEAWFRVKRSLGAEV